MKFEEIIILKLVWIIT